MLTVVLAACAWGTAALPASAQYGKPPSQHDPPNLGVFSKGEQLTWEVSYLSIKLGSITTRVNWIDTVNGRPRYFLSCLIQSYRGVPFVSLLTRFQSTMDGRLASVSFSTKERYKDTTNKYINYTYPSGRDVVFVSERIGNTPNPRNYDTIPLEGKLWQDGLSLLFYARAHAHQQYNDHVPVLIYRSKATTSIAFGVRREEVDIDAVDYPVSTWKLEGETGFTGIFGLTGGFEGWFSADNAAVPIVAKMHVLIGSIRIELVSWKKPGWGPPRAARK